MRVDEWAEDDLEWMLGEGVDEVTLWGKLLTGTIRHATSGFVIWMLASRL